ncbi:MAG: DUF429 domain-containing protein [Candidatus Micrarchaeia archaeon]
MSTKTKNILGIDLAGSNRRDTGVSTLCGKKFVYIGKVKTDDEIMNIIKKFRPVLVAVDAPLTLPKGRKDIDDKNGVHFRECDLELRRLGIRFFPITIGPMRMLVKRGIRLKKIIEKLGIRVVEVFPGASYDIFGIDRKNREKIVLRFRKMRYVFDKRKYTQDELDGMCCAITGQMVLSKKAKALKGIDGTIFIPLGNHNT